MYVRIINHLYCIALITRNVVHNEIWRINSENSIKTYTAEKGMQNNNFANFLYMFDVWSHTLREEYKYICLEAKYMGEILNVGRMK
jgi:hypothetical protein